MNGAWQNRAARRRGGCLVTLFGLGVALAAAVALAWMLLLPELVVARIRERTGFNATVASLSANAFTGRLRVRGLVLTNPATFPTGDFLELREFSADGDLWSWGTGRPKFDDLTLDVRKVTLVRRADGISNADLFQRGLGARAATGADPAAAGPAGAQGLPKPPAGGGEAGRSAFLIRRLTLRFDELVVADYSGVKPEIKVHRLGLDQRYENVTEAKQIVVPEVLRRLAAANVAPTLGALVAGDLGKALGEQAREAEATGAEWLKEAGQKTNELIRGLREKLEETKKP